MGKSSVRLWSFISLLALLFGALGGAPISRPALAQSVSSVALVGDLQSEIGCPGDWQPECGASLLNYDSVDDVYQAAFDIPAGSWHYKTALNGSWDENYGANAQSGGADIPLVLNADTQVKFYYDHKSHWITDNVNSTIVTVPGSFQSELGCPGDWQPDCLRSWLQDIDGDGVYRFETTALPAGNYEGKAAINESWAENYGQGGVRDGANIPFTVPFDSAKVIFVYNASTHLLTIQAGHALDNNIEWDGLKHDSRDTLYRTPGGAVPAGVPVKVRFRTFHNDVSSVLLRVYSLNNNGQSVLNMRVVASDVSCSQDSLAEDTCDYWEADLANHAPDNLWYRFFITDGSDTDYYDDNTAALDGGSGAATEDVEDHSWALMFYEPGFTAPAWAKGAVIYQIFPDRFRNGNPGNDPKTGDIRYDDPVLKLPWGTLPEGYCRNYADGDTNCPWRYDDTPPDWSPEKEGPRGRDYYGGDLKGVYEKLDYLKQLGVNVIYFNPIFGARSNHRYDTSDYENIDPALGTNKDFELLVQKADKLGIRIVLDGVYNHMSSDSAYFDRYQHYTSEGACESAVSTWRSWFYFRPPAGSEPGPCAPSTPGGNDTYYDGWFGFDSIPVINKTNPDVQSYFLTAPNSITRMWLDRGASGWRMDVMGDASFPNGYWEKFREVVKAENSDAIIIGELWQKDSTLLRYLRGDRADTTMNYRLRDAVLGLLAPQGFDSKGFADSGHQISASEFASRVLSIREDYPDAAYYSLMNLLGSHDTERLLWTLTPGAETSAEKEQNAANLADGKQRVKLASLIQYTMPGAPTVYYGDEVSVTGDDDPDDRRTYPWKDKNGITDDVMLAHYKTLAAIRQGSSALVEGDIRFLVTDDPNQTVVYGRKTASEVAIVLLNLGDSAQNVIIPVAGYLPEGTVVRVVYGVGNAVGAPYTVTGGVLTVPAGGKSGMLLSVKDADLMPPAAPTNLHVTNEGSHQVSLEWNPVSGAAGYNIYRSFVSGGGWSKLNASLLSGPSFMDSGLTNAMTYYYTVTALDSMVNESEFSDEISAMPHLSIGWANLQWPPSMTHTISTTGRTDNVYGQVWIDGVTQQPGPAESLRAQLGHGPDGSDPAGNPDWTWVEASFNVNAGNNDEFAASLLPEYVGEFDYAYRYSTTNGRDWLYADLDGTGNGYTPAQSGSLSVSSSGDTTPPAVPAGLIVVSASPAGVDLSWDPLAGDPTLFGFEVRRASTPGGPYATLALVSGATTYSDLAVTGGETYYYVVRAVDASFNRSGDSAEVFAKAELRTVTLVFNVTVPASTDGTGRPVYIAGFLDRLNGGLPQWNPGGVVMTRVDATTWTITLTGKETTQIEYKYALGDWDHVEKDGACGEVANRLLTLSYGSSGSQTVNDSVLNWRNVEPCGN